MRRTPLLERRPLQRKAEPAPPLPIQLDVFKTIRTAGGKQITTQSNVAELWYSEHYGREFIEDAWSQRVGPSIGGTFNSVIYVPSIPIKAEFQNATDVTIFVNLTGQFEGPGAEPAGGVWNQAIPVPSGTFLTVTNLEDMQRDSANRPFFGLFFGSSIPTTGIFQTNLYFAEKLGAPFPL